MSGPEVSGLAWVLNLDAEEELRDPQGYRRSAAMARRIEEHAAHLGGLVAPGDRRVGPVAAVADGRPGRAWCPTPAAQAALEAAGARVGPAPPVAVLARVNARDFAHALEEEHERLPGARWVRGVEELQEEVPGAWVLKAALGFAGRRARRVRRPLDRAAQRWVEARLEEGDGVLLEPWVERVQDVALHGWVTRGGATRLGAPTVQRCDDAGRWLGTRRAVPGELEAGEVEALRAATARCGAALAEAGYFGPFGVDGFRWRDREGRARFRPLGELNARFSMGWAVGAGEAGRAWVVAGE